MIDDWKKTQQKVYWDRSVDLDVWRKKISECHRSYLPDAISTLMPNEFVRFYGLEEFKADWPRLRASLSGDVLRRVHSYDAAWSKAVCGGWNLKPVPDFYTMPKKRREFLIQVAKTPGLSIYEIAKMLRMQYRRAYDHASVLLSNKEVTVIELSKDATRTKRIKRLFPSMINNQGVLKCG